MEVLMLWKWRHQVKQVKCLLLGNPANTYKVCAWTQVQWSQNHHDSAFQWLTELSQWLLLFKAGRALHEKKRREVCEMGWTFVDLNSKFAQPILGPWANIFYSNLVDSGTMPSLILTDMLIDLEAKAPSKLSRKKPCKEKTRKSRSEKLRFLTILVSHAVNANAFSYHWKECRFTFTSNALCQECPSASAGDWGWQRTCTFACVVTTPCTHPHQRAIENKMRRSWGACICVSGVDMLCLYGAFSHRRKGCHEAACSGTGSRLDWTLATLSLLVALRSSLTPLLCLNFLHSSCLYMKLYHAFILLIPLSFVSWTKVVLPEGKHRCN